jgi:predicted aspartyl protease
VVHGSASEGDLALARKDYDAALAFFREQLAREPASMEAQLGLVRSLIGKDQVTEARTQAKAALDAAPTSAIAEVAAGEVEFRAANFSAAQQHAIAGDIKDPCEGQLKALLAKLYTISAFYASAASALETAHRLRPDDELIRRDWIESLPRGPRLVALQDYLADKPALSDKDLRDDLSQVDILKHHHPGECHVSLKADSATIPLKYARDSFLHTNVHLGIDVFLNGNHRRLAFDTGAPGILLTAATAKSLGLAREVTSRTSGIGDSGDIETWFTHVASVHIGDIELSDCMVQVLSAKNKSMTDIDGLIGIDLFRDFLITLDVSGRQLQLDPLPNRASADSKSSGVESDDDAPLDAVVPPQLQNWLKFTRFGHLMLVPSRVNDGQVHQMAIDTGVVDTTLSFTCAKEVGEIREEPRIKTSGISGTVSRVVTLDHAALQFGNARLPPLSYHAFDMTKLSHEAGAEISGLVGLSTLYSVKLTIDYRDNLMQLK